MDAFYSKNLNGTVFDKKSNLENEALQKEIEKIAINAKNIKMLESKSEKLIFLNHIEMNQFI